MNNHTNTEIESTVETLSYSYEVGGGKYTISSTVSLRKNTPVRSLKIEGWSNSRCLFVDHKAKKSYFQASSEGNECHRCSICHRRMKTIGWRTNHDFVRLDGYRSLYQVIQGVPKDLEPETLRQFLGLPVVG